MKKKIILVVLILGTLAFIFRPILKSLFTNKLEDDKARFSFNVDVQSSLGKDFPLEFNVPNDVSKVALLIDGTVLKTFINPTKKASVKIKTASLGVGAFSLELKTFYKDKTQESDLRTLRVLSDILPQQKRAVILNTSPHDVTSYTQGLEFLGNQLFEGTGDPGQKGSTTIGHINQNSGSFSSIKNGLDATYFGEGITILNNNLYQLTWKSGKCFVYDPKTLQLKSDFDYTGEGWGLCNNGTSLIMSDGTEIITFRDPTNFTIQRSIQVYDNTGAVGNLNELEYIDGKIYANVYTTNVIVVIDPKSGKILEQIDASEVTSKGKGILGDVLNGIAYNKVSKKVFLTGKFFSIIAEVRFDKL